ncbi:MAG TPA: aromatic ring-hydroxylating dioxygenase subunit alpha, partial [Nocardioides sp.]|nr:aromatic ring-hydroxylating dioxygenase subunit alpha [Nocardioides sp.]
MTTIPPAPLDPEQVALALAPFGESRLLPRDAYVSQEVLEWERRYLFDDWMCVGRSADIPATGLRAESVGGYGVLLVRDKDGVLRAFENACRHRGHELLPCGGSAESPRAIVCPYHAWSYRHDGSLIGAPNFKDIDAHYDRSTLGLVPMRVHEWHGWVFVDRTGSAQDFTDHIGELETIVAPYDAESLVTAETHTYEVEANWKVIVENYQECYHCSMIHPELCRISPPNSGDNYQERTGSWVGGWMDLRAGMETMSLDGRSGGLAMARLDEHELSHVMYAAVLPNLLISL